MQTATFFAECQPLGDEATCTLEEAWCPATFNPPLSHGNTSEVVERVPNSGYNTVDHEIRLEKPIGVSMFRALSSVINTHTRDTA